VAGRIVLLVLDDVAHSVVSGAVLEQVVKLRGDLEALLAYFIADLLALVERCVDEGCLDRFRCDAGCCLVDRNRRGGVLWAQAGVCCRDDIRDGKSRFASREVDIRVSNCVADLRADREDGVAFPRRVRQGEPYRAGCVAGLLRLDESRGGSIVRAQCRVSSEDLVINRERRLAAIEQVLLERSCRCGVLADRKVKRSIPRSELQGVLDRAASEAGLLLIQVDRCHCVLRAQARVCCDDGVAECSSCSSIFEEESLV